MNAVQPLSGYSKPNDPKIPTQRVLFRSSIVSRGVCTVAILLFTNSCLYSQNQSFWMNAFPSPNGIVCAIACGDSGVFGGIDYGGVVRSTDNGLTWSYQNDGITDLRVRGIAVSSNGSVIATSFGGSVFRSTDNGSHWSTVAVTIQGSYATPVVAGSNGVLYATGDKKYFKSTNNGQTWSEFDQGKLYSDSYCLTIRPDGNALAGISGGVQWSEDGGTSWSFTATIFCSPCNYFTAVWSVATTHQGLMFAGSHYGIVRNSGDRWSWLKMNFPDGLPAVRCIVADVSGRVFAGTEGAGIFESFDNGETWTPNNDSLTDSDVHSLASTQDGFVYAGTFGGGIYKSRYSTPTVIPPLLVFPRDDTLNLATNLRLGWRKSELAQSYELQLSKDPTFSTGIIVDTAGIQDTSIFLTHLDSLSMYFWRVAGVQGASFRFSNPHRFVTGPVQPPELDFPSNGMVVPTNVVFSWYPATGGDWYSIMIYDSASGTIVETGNIAGLSCTSTVLRTGKSYLWNVFAVNAVTLEYSGLSETRHFSTIAATDVKSSLSSEAQVPADYVLAENYPNPFNPETMIKFGLPNRSSVRVEVYDLVGKRVAILASGVMKAGYHVVTFDGSNLASGVYLCRLQAGNRTITRKLLLLR